MGAGEALLLVGGGLVAGVVNTLAGGGSLLTVPLLVLLGLPGILANGTNRVGILCQNLIALGSFRAQGVDELRRSLPVLAPVALGSLLGALAVSQVADETFERIFGLLMLLLLVPTLRGSRARRDPARSWSPATSALVFFGVGVYAGAFQAGVGIPLLLALSRTGLDLVRANAVKVSIIAIISLVAVPVFAWQGQIAWGAAGLLTLGFAAGGALGARLAVRGGERLIRPALAVAVVALAARMLGLF